MIVIAEGTCMVRLLQVLTRFYHHESCGQCTPCREGTGWMHRILDRIVAGEGRPRTSSAAPTSQEIQRRARRSAASATRRATPVTGILDKFRDEFEYYIEHKRSRYGGNSRCCERRLTIFIKRPGDRGSRGPRP